MTDLLRLAWLPRAEPLPAVAAFALGPAARPLGERLLRLPAAQQRRLRGVAGRGVLAVLGDTADLPWIDGVVYCGRDPRAPLLLVPTHRQPSVDVALLERAVLARHRNLTPPLLLADSALVPMGEALALAEAALTRALAEVL